MLDQLYFLSILITQSVIDLINILKSEIYMIDLSAIYVLPSTQKDCFFYIFYGTLFLLILRLVSFCFLSFIYTSLKIKDDFIMVIKKIFGIDNKNDKIHKISLIVPAYNEEITISSCIKSMLNLNYPDYEVIVVDDGSSDDTFNEASKFIDEKLKVIYQKNSGKPGAVNTGIKNASGDIVITVDADSKLHPDALKWISRRFSRNHRLGAVAGNVKIDKPKGLLKILQSLEYTISINLGRKSQSLLHCVMIVPGAIAALKTEVVKEVGYFSLDTFAEDFDITMSVLQAGYHVEYESRAIAFTQAPESIEDFMKQRRRWFRGMMQVLAKHQRMYLNRKNGIVGLVGVPYMWLELGSCLINMIMLCTLFTAAVYSPDMNSLTTGILVYWALSILVSIYAVVLDPVGNIKEIIVSPLYIFYNVFLDGISIMAFIEETMNIAMSWEKPKREEM